MLVCLLFKQRKKNNNKKTPHKLLSYLRDPRRSIGLKLSPAQLVSGNILMQNTITDITDMLEK